MAGKISDDPLVDTLESVVMAGLSAGANVRVPATLFTSTFATVEGLSAVDVPADVVALRTNGYSAEGDAGAWPLAVEIPVDTADQPWHRLSNGGTRRWELRVDCTNPYMFGAIGDGTVDDYDAVKACDDYGQRIFLPYKDRETKSVFRMSKTWNIKRPIYLEGPDGMHVTAGGYGATLKFDDDIVGLFFHRFDTDADDAGTPEVLSPTTTGADGSIVKNIAIYHGGGIRPAAADVNDKHGIWAKCHIRLQNVLISGFGGHGLNIVADVSGDATTRGNANHFEIDGVRCQSNGRSGTYIDGADANAGGIVNLDGTGNGEWGVYDDSFLGNAYTGGHMSTNGGFSQVSHGGNRYYVLDEDLASTTEPGTDSTVWVLVGAGGVHSIYPAWVEGNYYKIGGAFAATNANARGTFTGMYTESGQPPAHVLTPWLVLNGQHAAGFTVASTSGRLSVELGAVRSSQGVNARHSHTGVTREAILGGSGIGHILQTSKNDLTGTGPYRLRYSGEDIIWDYLESAPTRALTLTGVGTTFKYGRVNTIPHTLAVPKIAIGSDAHGRMITYGASAPVTVDCAKGDIHFNNAPTSGGYVGWVCLTAGNGVDVNGIWATFGLIS